MSVTGAPNLGTGCSACVTMEQDTELSEERHQGVFRVLPGSCGLCYLALSQGGTHCFFLLSYWIRVCVCPCACVCICLCAHECPQMLVPAHITAFLHENRYRRHEILGEQEKSKVNPKITLLWIYICSYWSINVSIKPHAQIRHKGFNSKQ